MAFVEWFPDVGLTHWPSAAAAGPRRTKSWRQTRFNLKPPSHPLLKFFVNGLALFWTNCGFCKSRKRLNGLPQPNPPSALNPQMDKFWSPEAVQHLMHQEFTPTPPSPWLPPDGPLLQRAHPVFIKRPFHKGRPLVKVVIWWKINGAAWLQLIFQWSAKDQLTSPKSKIQQGSTFTANLQTARVSFWYAVTKYFSEDLYVNMSAQSPLFPGWNLRHVTWYMGWRGCKQAPVGGIHLHKNPLNCILLQFFSFQDHTSFSWIFSWTFNLLWGAITMDWIISTLIYTTHFWKALYIPFHIVAPLDMLYTY